MKQPRSFVLAIAVVVVCLIGGTSFAQSGKPAVKKPFAICRNRVDGAEMVYIPAGEFKIGDDQVGSISELLGDVRKDN